VSGILVFRNRQHLCRVNSRLLRKIIKTILRDRIRVADFELGVTLVSAREITGLNETYLRHGGATDVIAFDYADDDEARQALSLAPSDRETTAVRGFLHGEIFICLNEALTQARRFRTTWQSELTRYLIHGLLHLQGHDDQHPAARHKMKLQENRLLRSLGGQFDFSKLGQLKPQTRKLKPRVRS
jgi:probable rRNA maturation factor